MHVKVTVKRHKEILGKQYIDIECQAQSDSLSDDMDTNIFVVQKLPKNALGQTTSQFSHVADPVDLQDYPPYPAQDLPYFRTNQITLRVRSEYQTARIISVLEQEVQNLRTALTLPPVSEQTLIL